MERTANIKIEIGELDICQPMNVGELDICQPMNVGELDIKTYHIPGLRLIEDGSLRLSSYGLRFLR
jgi:hypothetical protein